MLWDVLILLRDIFNVLASNGDVMERLLASPPAKFLELGTDQLLADHLGGGGGKSASGSGSASGSTSGGDAREKREHEEQVDTDDPVPSPKRLRPLEHSEWDWINSGHRVEVLTKKCVTEGR